MADTLNLEAERAAFEKEARKHYGKEHFEVSESIDGWGYRSAALNGAWDGWLMARRSSSSVSEGEMPDQKVFELLQAAGIPEANCRTLYAGHDLFFSWERVTSLIRAATKAAAPADAPMRECPDCEGTAKLSANEWCGRCDRSGILPGRAPAEDAREEVQDWIILQKPGCVPELKGPMTSKKQKEDMLRELYDIYPGCICTLVEMPRTAYPQSGREWISMYGDKRRKPLPPEIRASSTPAVPGTGREKKPYGFAVEARDGHITFFKERPTGFDQPRWEGLVKVVPLLAAPSHPLEVKAGELATDCFVCSGTGRRERHAAGGHYQCGQCNGTGKMPLKLTGAKAGEDA